MKNLVLIILLPISIEFFPHNAILNLLSSENTSISNNFKDIPSNIVDEMSNITNEKIILSNPNEKFNISDHLIDKNLPIRRLVFALNSNAKNKWLIFYERGGRSHNHLLSYVILRKDGTIDKIYNMGVDLEKEKRKDVNFLINKIKDRKFMVIYNNGKKLKRPYYSF